MNLGRCLQALNTFIAAGTYRNLTYGECMKSDPWKVNCNKMLGVKYWLTVALSIKTLKFFLKKVLVMSVELVWILIYFSLQFK